ncbi:glucose-6-phosphatase 3-like [Watersipora subatra]|uniref:glucose-6-phosphatase 3-like n=1 Tax=Watersipora subatra TaxID=2589382 RepID=UPI00355C3E64
MTFNPTKCVHMKDEKDFPSFTLESWEVIFLLIHQLASPWMIYFMVFPIIYYQSMRVGLRIVWAAALAEYVCIIFKLLLHGHRPYWYAMESLYHIAAPKIRQVEGWTCETTPATASCDLVSSLLHSDSIGTHNDLILRDLHSRTTFLQVSWLYHKLQAIIIFSGAYLAITFPHQAAIGSIMGSLIASRLSQTNVLQITFKGFCWVIAAMMAVFYLCYGGLWFLGYDPAWAVSKASMACMKLSWTELYREALVLQAFRAAGFVTGLALSLRFFTMDKLKITDSCPFLAKIVHAMVGGCVITLLEIFLQPPFGYNSLLHYTFIFIKYTVPPLLIITEVPFITGVAKLIICEVVLRDGKTNYHDILSGHPGMPWSVENSCAPSPLIADECCISAKDNGCASYTNSVHVPNKRAGSATKKKRG